MKVQLWAMFLGVPAATTFSSPGHIRKRMASSYANGMDNITILVFVCLHRRIHQHTFKERKMRDTRYYLLEPEDSEPLACATDASLVPIAPFTSLSQRGSENGYMLIC